MIFSNKDDEIAEIRNEISLLKVEIEKRTTEDQRSAKQASKMCSEFRNRSEKSQAKIEEYYDDASIKIEKINSYFDEIKVNRDKIEEINQHAKGHLNYISTVDSKISSVNEMFEGKDELSQKIVKIEELYDGGIDASNKINALLVSSLKKKQEIDQIYYEVYGYTEEKQEGEPDDTPSRQVEGLKDELEKAYDEVLLNTKKLEKYLTQLNEETSEKYKEFIDTEEEKYELTFKKIKDLLPDALTAGLSHAYSEKKDDEIEESNKFKKTFLLAIAGLVLVSSIPFLLNFYLFTYQGKTIESIIGDLPNMVFSILPLYIPIVWLAYSAGKKVNLSKRLIEEYSHKEVLSKTYEGLSNQVEEIGDSEISSELKIKLLHNILTVSAENPGKLISDYNTADHPILDKKVWNDLKNNKSVESKKNEMKESK